jgi:O-antigen/teichoic acid export membrane protein
MEALSTAIENQNISQRAIQSSIWLFARRVSANLIRLGALAVLARKLSPSDFGLVALAQVLLQFIVLTGSIGIGTYVIYDREVGWESRVNSAFWLNFIITVVQLGIVAVALPIIPHFYSQPGLQLLLLVLSGAFFVRQMRVVPEALIQRELKYQQLVVRDSIGDVISASISIVLAIVGWGVWSLVIPQIILEPIMLAVVFSIAKWCPTLRFGSQEWPRIGKYSLSTMGSNILGLVLNDGDTLLVGKVLGLQSLGYYNAAWQLSNLIGRNVTSVVTSVALPSLAMLEKNRSRLRSSYCRMVKLLSIISFPLLFGMFVLADDFVNIIYGRGWEPVVLILRIFIIFTLVRSVTSPSSAIYNVLGRPDIGLKLNLSFLPVYLAAIYFGSGWGVLGVAIGVMAVRTIGGIIALALSTKLIQYPFHRFIAIMYPAMLTASMMSVVVWGMKILLLSWDVGIIIRLLICIIIGAILYIVGLMLSQHETYKEIMKIVVSILGSAKIKMQPYRLK